MHTYYTKPTETYNYALIITLNLPYFRLSNSQEISVRLKKSGLPQGLTEWYNLKKFPLLAKCSYKNSIVAQIAC